jgi:hypothetical protein
VKKETKWTGRRLARILGGEPEQPLKVVLLDGELLGREGSFLRSENRS